MSEADHTEIIELLARTDTETAGAVAAIQRLGLRSLLRGQSIGIDDIAEQAELTVDDVRAGVNRLLAAGRIETDGTIIVGVGGLTFSATRPWPRASRCRDAHLVRARCRRHPGRVRSVGPGHD